MWDDKSLLNVDFSLICNAYTVKDINTLEKQASSGKGRGGMAISRGEVGWESG